MKPGSGPTELQRALAREDVDYLRHCTEVYREWNGYGDAQDEEHVEPDDIIAASDDEVGEPVWFDELDVWHDASDPERGLALLALAMANYDEIPFLCLISAGMLEDILSHSTHRDKQPVRPDILQRIVNEARRTPRFRWMLSGVWTMGCSPDVAEAIQLAVGTANMDTDPLPPRPHA